MIIRDVLAHAAFGVLNQLAIKDNSEAVISFINLGLIDLHKRFLLKVEEYVIDVEERKSMYSMPDDYMYMLNATDLGLSTTTVSLSGTEDVSRELSINVDEDPISIFTPYFNKIQVPKLLVGHAISLVYCASPEVVYDAEDELELPVQLLECLVLFIGYQAYASMDVKALAAENTFYRRYTDACEQIRLSGTINSNNMYIVKDLQSKGYV